mmetsp:Transcript_90649/g.240800  ORF Transcript_90649/g.240800 Transcript_90649/m.240800 type:complete len:214 (-) Transcript_90649:1024-1665(-)
MGTASHVAPGCTRLLSGLAGGSGDMPANASRISSGDSAATASTTSVASAPLMLIRALRICCDRPLVRGTSGDGVNAPKLQALASAAVLRSGVAGSLRPDSGPSPPSTAGAGGAGLPTSSSSLEELEDEDGEAAEGGPCRLAASAALPAVPLAAPGAALGDTGSSSSAPVRLKPFLACRDRGTWLPRSLRASSAVFVDRGWACSMCLSNFPSTR